MDWISWSQTWSTKSTTTTSRKPLKRRRKYFRWRRKYLLLQADQRLKQNQEDLPLLAHLEEFFLLVKQYGLILSQELNLIKHTKCQNDWLLFFVMVIYLNHKMERLNSGDWKMIFGTNLSTLNIGLMICGRAWWQEAEATRKDFNIVLTRQDKKFFIFELFKVIQDAIPLILHFRTMCQFRTIFFEYTYHIGCAVSLHSITNSGLIAGGQNSSRERQTVFFTAVNPMNKDHKDPYKLDLTKPRLASYEQKWRRHQDTVYWVDTQLAQRKGLKFYQTRCNAIILHDTLPAYCISNFLWWNLETSFSRTFLCHLYHHRRFPSKKNGWKI